MKPLKVSDKLDTRQKNYIKKKFGIKKFDELRPKVLKQLKEALKSLTDTRISYKCSYKIWDIVMCVVISVLCGKKDWEEIHDFVTEKYDFFRSFLLMTGGIPSAKTYERIMSIINYKELENILVKFFKTITQDLITEIELLSFDGRVSNGSKRKETLKREEVTPLNMLNVYSSKYQMCIASQMIDEKTNEIPNVEELLKCLNVKETIVSWDALNTQKSNIVAAVDSKAEYVAPIKGNHPIFYQELIDFFDEKECECIIAGKLNTGYKKCTEYKNGSLITYEYFQTSEVSWYEDKQEWKKLASFGMVRKKIETKEKVSIECRYYISSLNVDIDLFSKVVRDYWGVENKLHWHLDVTFRQDQNRTLNKNALANLEIVNKFCLGILKRVQPLYGISLKRIMGKLGTNVEGNFLELLALLVLVNNNDC